MRVAVLGTGIMGSGMARNLARAGHEVIAWNRTREKAEALREDGVQVADSPAEAAAGADAIVTMLPTADVVEQVVREAQLGEGALWLQTSTVGLDGFERLRRLAEERGAILVDAPVLGTKEPAEKGELTVLASGPDEALDRSEPAFDAIGQKTIRLGGAGRGSAFKLVLNSWLLVLVEGLGETMGLARALGFDPALFLETIAGGPLDSAYAQLKGRAIVADEFPPSFPLELAAKDAGLVVEAADRVGIELPAARAIAGQFRRAVEAGLGDEDMAAVARLARVKD